MSTPYTYLLGWSLSGKYYYGVRFAKGCHPNDLLRTYFTSSRYVKEHIRLWGLPDIVKIRKTFANAAEARAYENKVLRRISAHTHESFLNKTNNKAIYLDSRTRKQISERVKSDWKKNPGRNDYRIGTHLSADTRNKISKARTGHKDSNEVRAIKSDVMQKLWKDPGWREVMAKRPKRSREHMIAMNKKANARHRRPFNTPWGIFDSIKEAVRHPHAMLKDSATLKQSYLDQPDVVKDGVRSPIRGHTPRQAGYYWL